MSMHTRLNLAVASLLGVLVIGSAGYMLIEEDRHISLLDSIYMTVVTVSTVGFKEVWPLSGPAKVWTIGVIVFGIGTVSVAFTSLISLIISGELRFEREKRKMETTISDMRNHVILCGYGRMGSLAVREMVERGLRVVVVEVGSSFEDALREAGIPHVIGDATDEEVLKKAGLMNARALVAALPSDADNVYIALTARTLRSDVLIVGRAEQPGTEAKLKRAGASRVICPQVIGATQVANVLTRPNVVDLVEMANKGVDLEIDEYVVARRSPLEGATLRGSALREKTGASVVAIKRADGETLFNPDPAAVLAAGDTLVLVGPAGVSARLDKL